MPTELLKDLKQQSDALTSREKLDLIQQLGERDVESNPIFPD